MSEKLKSFLGDWLVWVDGGSTDGQPFDRRHGLCCAFENWLDDNGVTSDVAQEIEYYGLTTEFRADGLSALYPFGGAEAFYLESGDGAMHLNADRINWVRSKVAQHVAA